MPKYFTTKQAAAQIGVSRETLYTWIERELVEAPEVIPVGGASIRLWTKADIAKAAKMKGVQRRGPKGKGKKRK